MCERSSKGEKNVRIEVVSYRNTEIHTVCTQVYALYVRKMLGYR